MQVSSLEEELDELEELLEGGGREEELGGAEDELGVMELRELDDALLRHLRHLKPVA